MAPSTPGFAYGSPPSSSSQREAEQLPPPSRVSLRKLERPRLPGGCVEVASSVVATPRDVGDTCARLLAVPFIPACGEECAAGAGRHRLGPRALQPVGRSSSLAEGNRCF